MKYTKNHRSRRQADKLVLRRETIVQLTDVQLTEVVGGAIVSFGPICSTTASQGC
jgi:hypothetical protein